MREEVKMKRKEEIILNPSCSEAVFQLDGIEFSVHTDTYPNGLVDSLLAHKDEIEGMDREEFVNSLILGEDIIDKLLADDRYQPVDNIGGGAHFEYVEKVIEAFMEFKMGLLSEEELRKFDEKLWHGEE